jgi:hypothetical protein
MSWHYVLKFIITGEPDPAARLDYLGDSVFISLNELPHCYPPGDAAVSSALWARLLHGIS